MVVGQLIVSTCGQDRMNSFWYQGYMYVEPRFFFYLRVAYGDHVIKPQDNINYLGVSLDSTLSGETMVNSVIKKVDRGLKFLFRHAHILLPNFT